MTMKLNVRNAFNLKKTNKKILKGKNVKDSDVLELYEKGLCTYEVALQLTSTPHCVLRRIRKIKGII